jgi:hypothetical protein
MQSHSTFDSLVGELSSKERKDLLEKIEASFRVSDDRYKASSRTGRSILRRVTAPWFFSAGFHYP